MVTTALSRAPGRLALALPLQRRGAGALGALVVAGAACLALGDVGGAGVLSLGTTLFAYIALAQAWNILGGFSGQMSLGVGAFVGTSAYAMALTMTRLGWSWPAGMAAGVVVAGTLSGLLAFPLLRLKGDYFAVGTLAATMALDAWFDNWSFVNKSTGVSVPIQAVPGQTEMYLIGLVVALIAVGSAIVMRWSTFGVRLLAIREDDLAAPLLGVNVFGYRLVVMVVSGMLIGLAGGVFALSLVSFVPDAMFAMSWTIEALVMVVIGGMGTVIGPIVGAVAVYYGITTELANFPTLSLFFEGGLLLVVVRFVPGGLWPFVVRSTRWLLERRGPTVRIARATPPPSPPSPPSS